MDVYLFQAALVCKHDGEKVRRELTRVGKAPEDPDDEHSYDSDDFPKGPYPDGGGESDVPEHCDICHMFLENPLTRVGMQYVLEALAAGRGDPDVLTEWAAFYDLEGPVTIKGKERYYDRGSGLVRVGEIGSISTGTLKLGDLITAGMEELDRLDPAAMKKISKEYPDIIERGFAESEDGEFAWEAIGEALGEHAPPNAYFGGHAGDSADIGFWFSEDL
jgi:hypothetical protein